jgi:2'-5' RNA ligase
LLPPDVETHLDDSVDGLRTAHRELRWVPASRWHLTLEFLGACGPHEVDRQRQRWERRARRSAPLTLRLTGAGSYPRPWTARVLWIGLGGEVDGWCKLAAFDQAPHVTVARTRERSDLTATVDELAAYSGPDWTADQMTLVASHLRGSGDRGPRYEPLESFALGG